MTRPSSRSGRWSEPASTSSPTERSVARATQTTSRRRWTASTSNIPERPSGAAGRTFWCPAWSARSGGRSRCRRATSRSCAPLPTARSRPPSPARSRCLSRHRTSITATPGRSLWRTPRRSTRSCTTSSPPVPTSFSSTSRGCRRGPSRRGNTPSMRSIGRYRGSRPRRSCTSATVTPRSCARRPSATRSSPSSTHPRWGRCRSRRHSRRLDLSVLRALASKRIAVGVLDLNDPGVEPVEVIAGRIRQALEHVDPERLVLAPDCGMKYLPRETAYGKLRAMAQAAAVVRAEL